MSQALTATDVCSSSYQRPLKRRHINADSRSATLMWSRVVLSRRVVEIVLRNAINREEGLRDKRVGGDRAFSVKVNFCLFKNVVFLIAYLRAPGPTC